MPVLCPIFRRRAPSWSTTTAPAPTPIAGRRHVVHRPKESTAHSGLISRGDMGGGRAFKTGRPGKNQPPPFHFRNFASTEAPPDRGAHQARDGPFDGLYGGARRRLLSPPAPTAFRRYRPRRAMGLRACPDDSPTSNWHGS